MPEIKERMITPTFAMSEEMLARIDEAARLFNYRRGRSQVVRDAVNLYLDAYKGELSARRLKRMAEAS